MAIIRSKGDTILGADDKAGIAEVLEALRVAEVRPPIEFAVSRQEEVGLLGVKAMDFERITARRGFPDGQRHPGDHHHRRPDLLRHRRELNGRSAHAGMEPEKGINAIQAAAKAITALPSGPYRPRHHRQCRGHQGRDHSQWGARPVLFPRRVPVGRSRQGGGARREDGGHDQDEIEEAGATVEIVVDEMCRAVEIPEDAWPVEIAEAGSATVGIDAEAVFMTGFTDASIYNNHGIEMAVIGIGAQNEHSTDECIAVADMEKAVKVLVEIFRLTASGSEPTDAAPRSARGRLSATVGRVIEAFPIFCGPSPSSRSTANSPWS